jgi:hypothetical protein
MPEQHIGKAGNQGHAENSHIEHCTHTAESTDVTTKLNTGINITRTVYFDSTIVAIIYTVETSFQVYDGKYNA